MAPLSRRWWRDVEVVLPVALLGATTVYLAAAFRISTTFSAGPVDASFMPKLIAGLMYLALLLVLRDALKRRSAAGEEAAGAAAPLVAPALVVALTAVYVAVFKTAGYTLSTLPYVYLLFYVFRFEEKSQLKRIAYAVAITAVFYGLFAGIFDIRLPTAGEIL